MNRETSIQNAILLEIMKVPGVRAWRANTGAAEDPKTGRKIYFGVAGQADITGIGPGGLRIEIECKSPKGTLSNQQKAFRDMIVEFGGVYVVARNPEKARDDLSREIMRKWGQNECPSCGMVLSVDLFAKNKHTRSGLQTYCRSCSSEKVYSSRYGISQEEYRAILERQGNKCAICLLPADQNKDGHLHIDHDHRTGKVRGLLCFWCNSGLGKFRDNQDFLSRAAFYVQDFEITQSQMEDISQKETP